MASAIETQSDCMWQGQTEDARAGGRAATHQRAPWWPWAMRILISCLLAGATAAFAQPAYDPGTPFITRFGAESYNVIPRHLSINRDAKGRIVAGNAEGLLIQRFGQFELVRLPNASYARCTTVGPDQTLYVGGYDQLGKIVENVKGEFEFESLVEKFPLSGDAAFIGDVWDAQATTDGVFFLNDQRVLHLSRDGEGHIIPIRGDGRGLFVEDDVLYLRASGHGLSRWHAGAFELLPGGEVFADKPVVAMLKRERDVLISAGKSGYYSLHDGQITPLKTALDGIAEQVSPYSLTALRDGSIAVGTLSGEMLQISSELALMRRFKASNFPIVATVADAEGGVWAATEGELLRVVLPAAWSVYGSEDGLHGALLDAVWSEGELWVGTSLGLYRGAVDARGRLRFADTGWTQDEIWDLHSLRQGVLVTRRGGVDWLRGGKLTRLFEMPDSYQFQASRNHPQVVWALGAQSVVAIDVSGELPREGMRITQADVSVSSLAELDADHLLLGNFRGTPLMVDWNPAQFTVRAVMPLPKSPKFNIKPLAPTGLMELDDEIYLTQEQALFRWNQGQFESIKVPQALQALQPLDELVIRHADDGRVFAFHPRALFMRAADSRQWQALDPRDAAGRGIASVSPLPDGRVIVLSWSALLHYDPRVTPPPLPNVPVQIGQLTWHRGQDSKTFVPNQAAALRLPPNDYFQVEFGVERAGGSPQFRSRLLPVEQQWNDWRASRRREWHQLSPGDYTLEVQAMAADGFTASPLRVALHIEPRWFQRRSVQILGVLGGAFSMLGIGVMFARRRQRQVEEQNLTLERMVEERTQDLAQANQRLARIADLDGLTGVANRRRFDGYLQHQWETCSAAKEPLALMMVDVDHFKKFNDTRGHQAGDDELRAIARELQSVIQNENELVARYGGEEFCLVLPGVYLIEASRRAEALRTQIATRPTRHQMTVSIGVVSAVPSDRVQPRDLLQAADSALYEAKHKGRNKVVFAELSDH